MPHKLGSKANTRYRLAVVALDIIEGEAATIAEKVSAMREINKALGSAKLTPEQRKKMREYRTTRYAERKEKREAEQRQAVVNSYTFCTPNLLRNTKVIQQTIGPELGTPQE